MPKNTVMGVEDVVNALRQRIVEHEIPPGAKLGETALASQFNISRPKLREAFGILEERGLIERVRNQGAIVARLDVEQVRALFEVREVLEALGVRLATQNAEPELWKALRDRFEGPVEEALARNDIGYYLESISDFRQTAFREAGNDVLSQSLDTIYDRTKMLIRRIVLLPGRAHEGMTAHRSILEAMIAGDADLAEQLKRNNIRSSQKWFFEYRQYLL